MFRRLKWLAWVAAAAIPATADEGWFPFRPPPGPPGPDSVLNLRHLNEKTAGGQGRIVASAGMFVRRSDGRAVRFWGVNGPPGDLHDPAELQRVARSLAASGVNLVRIHRPVYDARGEMDPVRIRQAQATVAALRAEGIYTLFSIYFPLWLKPGPDCPFVEGYDGDRHPFAALMFHPGFQARYRSWWEALLLTPGPDGARLVDDPSVMGLEVQNEDSFFFWTFAEKNLPAPLLRRLETEFGGWAARRHGSASAAIDAWGGARLPGDAPDAGRLAFRPLWNLANERTARDRDTAAFLLETQTRFYRESIAHLRDIGYGGMITASNWTTADNRVLGPLEKLSYSVGDFHDRHGYFACLHRGDNAAWSIRPGHTFADRSALRFDPAEPGKPRVFTHPVMDIEYDGRPTMLSETTWNRPNRHRGEAPLLLAAYGALQGSDAVVHFAHDGADWGVKPGFWMQPWTLMAPTQAGQFPAAALLFRQSRIREGEVLADVTLAKSDLLQLRGTPLPQDAAFDELRLADVPKGTSVEPGQVVDPLIHFAGRTRVRFTDDPASAIRLSPLTPHVDRDRETVTSTTGELSLDYRRGLLRLNAPTVQGISGNPSGAGVIRLRDIAVQSDADVLHLVLISLDGRPIDRSDRMLLQVMTEERPTGWKTGPAEAGGQRILELGTDPWEVREVRGEVRFTGPAADRVRVTPLDLAGRPAGEATPGAVLPLRHQTLYYLVTR